MAQLPEQLLKRLEPVRSVGVVTGAGISAESGIPTYRGKGGIYDDPATGDRTVDALSATTLHEDPDRTWRTLALLAAQAGEASPNAAHKALAAIEAAVERFTLLTQNVDGLHRRAGSVAMIEIHGHVFDALCLGCGERVTLSEVHKLKAAPRCANCGRGLRPDVVLFEEMLDPAKVAQMQYAFHQNPLDMVLAVGTTAMFPYIAEPFVRAGIRGQLSIEVNPEQTPISRHVDFALRGPATEYLPLLAEAVIKDPR